MTFDPAALDAVLATLTDRARAGIVSSLEVAPAEFRHADAEALHAAGLIESLSRPALTPLGRAAARRLIARAP